MENEGQAILEFNKNYIEEGPCIVDYELNFR